MTKIYNFEPITIYTDGSAKGQFFGGWAYIINFYDSLFRKDSGGNFSVTNQQMELYAAIRALEFVDQEMKTKSRRVELYSDSAYLVNCYLQGWWRNWEKNGWRNSDKKDVANVELWQRLIPFFRNKDYSFIHVKGHSTNMYNNMCDEMAQAEAEKMKKIWVRYNEQERKLLSGRELV